MKPRMQHPLYLVLIGAIIFALSGCAPAAAPAPVTGLPIITSTATTTANLRSGPATTFDRVGEVGPGQVVNLVATSEDGGWYLLDSGAWLANFLVDPAPTALPVATQEIIDLVQGRATPAPAATTPAVRAPGEGSRKG